MRNLFAFIVGMDDEIHVSNNGLWLERTQYFFCPEKSNGAVLANLNSMVLVLEFVKERLANHEC